MSCALLSPVTVEMLVLSNIIFSIHGICVPQHAHNSVTMTFFTSWQMEAMTPHAGLNIINQFSKINGRGKVCPVSYNIYNIISLN